MERLGNNISEAVILEIGHKPLFADSQKKLLKIHRPDIHVFDAPNGHAEIFLASLALFSVQKKLK